MSRREGRLPAWFLSRVRAAVGAYMVLLAVLGDEHLGYYPVAAWALMLTAAGYAAVILVLRWRRSPRRWVTWALIGVDTVLIAVLAGMTGGGQSPFAPVLLLVTVGVAIRFGFRRAATAMAWTVPILVTLIVLVPRPARPGDQRLRDALWWTGHLTAAAVLAGVMSDRLDLAHQRRSEAEADTAVERRHLDLERDVRRRLETVDEERRAFLSSLLHEFRPSVASLSTLARALRRDEEELTPEERTDLLERVDNYAHHLDVVLREVAEVVTSESLEAEYRLHAADVYLPRLVGEAAALAGLPAERVVTRSAPGANVVRSDPDKCLRVLVHLLEEAGRRAPPETVIEVGIERRDDILELAVGPAGTGTPVAGLAEESLGLWIAGRLAEAMGGGLETVGHDGRATLRAWFATRPTGGTAADASHPPAGRPDSVGSV